MCYKNSRILEYAYNDAQEEWENPDLKPPDLWPSSGRIKFKDVTVAGYGERDLLTHINIDIKPGQKIGIVGRSGNKEIA
jgi:ABC-type multidrug transport system fused ATPase/permease subunit